MVYLGSFSKIISPGMRVGYMVGDPALIRKCTIGKQSSDLHTANLTQAIVDQFIRRGILPGHIRRICQDYTAQCDAMLRCLESFPEGVSFTRPEGGLFLWVDLPEGVDARAILDKAIQRKVAFVPGTHFYALGGHDNTLRLNFSASALPQIEQGMGILRDLISESI